MMGIYYCAVDWNEKKRIEPPRDFSIKAPGIFHPTNPFPNMVMMKNYQGYDFELLDDCGAAYETACEFEDITEQVYKEFLDTFPFAKDEIYEQKSDYTHLTNLPDHPNQ